MVLPDVRSKHKVTPYGEYPNEENGYWEGYLAEEDSREVVGYDWAADTVDKYLTNSADLLEDYADILDLDKTDFEKLTNGSELLNSDKAITALSKEELNTYTKSEILLKIIRDELLCRLEMERSELVVSLLESYTDEDYEKNKQTTLDGRKNAILRINETENG